MLGQSDSYRYSRILEQMNTLFLNDNCIKKATHLHISLEKLN